MRVILGLRAAGNQIAYYPISLFSWMCVVRYNNNHLLTKYWLLHYIRWILIIFYQANHCHFAKYPCHFAIIVVSFRKISYYQLTFRLSWLLLFCSNATYCNLIWFIVDLNTWSNMCTNAAIRQAGCQSMWQSVETKESDPTAHIFFLENMWHLWKQQYQARNLCFVPNMEHTKLFGKLSTVKNYDKFLCLAFDVFKALKHNLMRYEFKMF